MSMRSDPSVRLTRHVRPRAAALVTVLALVALAAVRAAGQGGALPGSAPAARVGWLVQPETVTVGDPFRVLVRVQAAAGATIDFPAGPDSTDQLEAMAPRAVRASADTAGVDQTAVYTLTAWDVGTIPLPLGDIVVHAGAAERRVPLGAVSVFVRSVLPADSALRVPKPARPPFDIPRSWWLWIVAGLIAIALIALLLWWWRRRRRRQAPARAVDPFAHAEREFRRVEALGLVDAGERGRFVALMVEVLRGYLAAEYEAALPSLTTSELLDVLRATRGVPHDRLAQVLREADLIKFARRPVTADRARDLGREVRAIVARVHEARVAEAAAAAATAAEAA